MSVIIEADIIQVRAITLEKKITVIRFIEIYYNACVRAVVDNCRARECYSRNIPCP